jgi:hypothetical protein
MTPRPATGGLATPLHQTIDIIGLGQRMNQAVWCEGREISLAAIRPFKVAAWVKELREKYGAVGVKR